VLGTDVCLADLAVIWLPQGAERYRRLVNRAASKMLHRGPQEIMFWQMRDRACAEVRSDLVAIEHLENSRITLLSQCDAQNAHRPSIRHLFLP
jgi:hypothetical protein